MKHSVITLLFIVLSSVGYAQKTTLTLNDVYAANELIFYGLDFSNFRLVEPDRINEGEEIKDVQFPGWNLFVVNEIPMSKMEKWFKKLKVRYYPAAVNIINNKVSEKDVVVRLPFHSDINQAQKSILNYEKPTNPNTKIGMVVSVEYFQKKPLEASAYVIFFDISNGAIISSEKIITKDVGNAQGMMVYWGQSCMFFIKTYYDKFYSKGL
jgi:hypothetical protein